MAITAEPDYRKYLDPGVLARIGALDLRARMIVEGYFTGAHRSPYRGLSVEFAAHRAYSQGDDLKHIDWKVFGRTNKYYVKEYEQETNLHLVLVVDCSESMAYASPASPMSKHDFATSLAAAMAYLALQQRDSVGLALFSETLTRTVRPSNSPGHWRLLVHELAGRTGPAKTSLRPVLDELAERIARRDERLKRCPGGSQRIGLATSRFGPGRCLAPAQASGRLFRNKYPPTSLPDRVPAR